MYTATGEQTDELASKRSRSIERREMGLRQKGGQKGR